MNAASWILAGILAIGSVSDIWDGLMEKERPRGHYGGGYVLAACITLALVYFAFFA